MGTQVPGRVRYLHDGRPAAVAAARWQSGQPPMARPASGKHRIHSGGAEGARYRSRACRPLLCPPPASGSLSLIHSSILPGMCVWLSHLPMPFVLSHPALVKGRLSLTQ